jgi:hypothetical protein
MTNFRHIYAVFRSRTWEEKGINMEPEREALRLSAMIAFFIGAFIIMWSIDSFQQKTLPTRIGEVKCTWWSATVQGCEAPTRSLSEVTRPAKGLVFNL